MPSKPVAWCSSQPPAAYWEKKEIDGGWDENAKPFLLLWTAAEQARLLGGSAEDEDLWDSPGARNRLAQLKSRLLRLLRKVSLSGKLVSVRGQGVQLKLDRQQIHLFDTPRGEVPSSILSCAAHKCVALMRSDNPATGHIGARGCALKTLAPRMIRGNSRTCRPPCWLLAFLLLL